MKPAAILALLTPVLAGLAGYVADQATRLPGAPQIDRTGLTALFVAGAAAGGGAAWTFVRHLLTEHSRAQDHARELERYPVQHELTDEEVQDLRQVLGVDDVPKLAAALGAVTSRLDALEQARVSARKQSARKRVTRS